MMKSIAHPMPPVVVRYLSPAAIETYLAQSGDQTLCVVGFGMVHRDVTHGCPAVWVDMPVLGNEAIYEVWSSDKPVRQYQDESMTGAGNEDIFFGCISVRNSSEEVLSEVVQRAYSGIFDFLQRSSYPHLLRVWNYFPEINVVENGIERYRGFCIGRHDAFVSHQKNIEHSPAASVLGSHGGLLVIYFLAARYPGAQIENPRQTSPYLYPKQYGPRSPTFSRATLAFRDSARSLFISGTASILGHETVHIGSVSLQTRETLANICAVIDQAAQEGFAPVNFKASMALKVYVRHAEHLGLVRDIIQEEWGELSDLVVLQADICRTDLLVEIEAVCWDTAY